MNIVNTWAWLTLRVITVEIWNVLSDNICNIDICISFKENYLSFCSLCSRRSYSVVWESAFMLDSIAFLLWNDCFVMHSCYCTSFPCLILWPLDAYEINILRVQWSPDCAYFPQNCLLIPVVTNDNLWALILMQNICLIRPEQSRAQDWQLQSMSTKEKQSEWAVMHERKIL